MRMTTSNTATIPFHGKGVLVSLMVLFGIELYLHNDDFLHRYRSVFAVGRAADKIVHVVEMQPTIVFMGNSRVDNGIAPESVSSILDLRKNAVVNLGIPGLNTRGLFGVVRELERRGALSGGQIQYILIGLDATLFSPEDELNYSVFFADRWEMAAAGEYRELLASIFRLWGFSANLKGLREPARMQDIFVATLMDREPWGGSVRDNLGYRAKQERLTAAERDAIPNQSPPPVPSMQSRNYLLGAIDRLIARGIRVGVFFTPRYRSSNEFELTGTVHSVYSQLLEQIKALGVELFHVKAMDKYEADLFSDPGHLNEDGARDYSTALAKAIQHRWSAIGRDQ